MYDKYIIKNRFLVVKITFSILNIIVF